VRRNQIDDVLNISTPTACQDAETVSAATVTATLAGQGVPMAWLFLYINMRAPASSFLGFLPFFSVTVQDYLRVYGEIKI